MIHKWVLHTSVWLYFDNCIFWLELLRAFQVSRLPRILTVDWLKHFLWCKNGAVGWQSLLLLRWRSPPCRFDPFESLSRSCSPPSNWNGVVSPKLRHPQIKPSRLCLPCRAWALSQLRLRTRQWCDDVRLPVVSRDKSLSSLWRLTTDCGAVTLSVLWPPAQASGMFFVLMNCLFVIRNVTFFSQTDKPKWQLINKSRRNRKSTGSSGLENRC